MEFSSNILLIGKQNSHNNLLSGYLSSKLDCQCPCFAIEQLDTIHGNLIKDNVILLIDAVGQLAGGLVEALDILSQSFAAAKVAFFNVDVNIPCEKLLLWPHVRGIFYDDANENNILNGVKHISTGKYWLPRRVTAQFMEHLHSTPGIRYAPVNQLTKRESHILELICNGNSNIEIAEDLNVSISTVKTHTYNLFKKLNVSNRVQAANIVRNLSMPER